MAIKKFKSYLKSIGIDTKPLLKRIEEIYIDCTAMLGNEPQDIFVDEYIDSEGVRFYTCVNFFYPNYFFAAEQFLDRDDYHVSNIPKAMDYCRIIKTNYDFKKSKRNSNINIVFGELGKVSGQLKATRKNCDHAMLIYNKYIKPNLVY